MDYLQFLTVLLHVDKLLGILIEQYGTMIYVLLFLIIFCETGLVVMPFLPGDSLLFIAGTFCAMGAMQLWLLVVLLVIAAITGNTVNYWLGSAFGHKILSQHQRWFNPTALAKTHAFYEKHGGKTIILARFTPIVRSFAPFIAGMSDMSSTKFQIYNVAGALLWVVGLLVSGYLFGTMPWVRDHLNRLVLLGVAFAILPLIFGAIWHTYRRLFVRSR